MTKKQAREAAKWMKRQRKQARKEERRREKGQGAMKREVLLQEIDTVIKRFPRRTARA